MKKKIMILLCVLFTFTGNALFALGNSEKADSANVITIGTSASYKPWAYQENDIVKGFEIDV